MSAQARSAVRARRPARTIAERGHRRHELRPVDQRQPFLAREPDRLEPDARGARPRPASARPSTDASPSPTSGRARCASGARSPLAPTDPRAGTTGTRRRGSGTRRGARPWPRALPSSPSRARSRAAASPRARRRPGTARPTPQAWLRSKRSWSSSDELLGDLGGDEAPEAGVDPVGVLAPHRRRGASRAARIRPRAVSASSAAGAMHGDVPDVLQRQVLSRQDDRPRHGSSLELEHALERARVASIPGTARPRCGRSLEHARGNEPDELAAVDRDPAQRPPRAPTRATTSWSGERSRSSTFMLTWTRPARGRRSPIACTPGIPPADSRTAAATARATDDVVGARDRRCTRRAARRAPTRTAPVRGIESARPGIRARARPSATRRSSSWRPSARKNAGRRPCPTSPYRNTGSAQLSRRGARRPRARPGIAASIATGASGTSGTTSTAPTRGCTPSCARRSMSSTARARPATSDSTSAVLVADEREDRTVVVGVGVHVEQRALLANARPISSIAPASRPSETFGTASSTIRTLRSRDGEEDETTRPAAGRAARSSGCSRSSAPTAPRSSSRRSSRSGRRSRASSCPF